VNITIYFIRARSNLIVSCPSEEFPILFNRRKGREQGIEEREYIVESTCVNVGTLDKTLIT